MSPLVCYSMSECNVGRLSHMLAHALSFLFQWHSLSREEQAKYYEMARKERQLHMQLYPGWSARDNYALQVKKKKRKKDRNQDGGKNDLSLNPVNNLVLCHCIIDVLNII